MTTFQIQHETTYNYRRNVAIGPHRLMLRPRDSHFTRLISAAISSSPPARLAWSHDVFGNSVAHAYFDTPTDKLRIVSSIVIDQNAPEWPTFDIATSAHSYPFAYSADDQIDLGAMRTPHCSDSDGQVRAWAHSFATGTATDTLTMLKNLNREIGERIDYRPRYDAHTQTPLETVNRAEGTCRDLAVLFAESVRMLGLGARIVSGYLCDVRQSAGGDSTHAWTDVYLPGAGWVTFDPTHGALGGANLVPVAVARGIDQVSPISGGFFGVSDDFLNMEVALAISTL